MSMYPQPYYPNLYQQSSFTQPQQPTVLPPQQIITAKGKASIDTLKLSPNSSVLIADETAPIVWKCTSDGLGNVSSEAYDITPHKDAAQVQQENMAALVLEMDKRLKKLEETYDEQSNTRSTNESTTKSYAKHGYNQKSVGNSQKYGQSTSNDAEDA